MSDPLCRPYTFHLTPGQDSDIATGPEVLADAPAMSHLIADKGYDSHAIVEAIERSGAKAVIPPRSCVKEPRETDFVLYAERYRIERFFNKLKHYRAVATRYAKRARNFVSLIYLAASVLWMK